jgi:hypothetical protein
MRTTRKDFEKPVTYTTVGYRIQHGGKWFVDKHAERVDEFPGYSIRSRSEALRILKQFIWDNHKNNGYTYDIADFYIEGRGFYKKD